MEQPLTFEYAIAVAPEHLEALEALLAAAGFEGFWEDGPMLRAYVPQTLHNPTATSAIIQQFGAEIQALTQLAPINWNTEWEKAYHPVQVGRFCQIVARFHTPQPGFRITVHLQPKMAFGTGHHATTRLVIEMMEHIDFQGKHVLDFGCGTGVLGIVAAALGATAVGFLDNDPVATENAQEHIAGNPELMGKARFWVETGGIDRLHDCRFDVILANINRNVHLDSLPRYNTLLRSGGVLVISGLLEVDSEPMIAHFQSLSFQLLDNKPSEGWVALQFAKV